MGNRLLQVALAGIGGWGRTHAEVIAELASNHRLECAAFCDPYADRHTETKQKLEAIGAKAYTDYSDMLEHPGIDFIVVATPIPLHKSMCIEAVRTRVPILLEKPPAVAIEDLDEMIEAQKSAGTIAAVNFQQTSGQAFRQLLQYLREGRIGRLQSVTAVGMWHRTQSYYNRTDWAGKLVHNGKYVLDGSICNALSHLLNNALLVAGSGDSESAKPVRIQAELYRGHHGIESEDTSCIRIETNQGIKVHYYSTLCNGQNDVPFIRVQGTGGELIWSYENTLLHIDDSGKETMVSFGKEDLVRNMYVNMIDAVLGETKGVFCSLADCRSFLLAANGAFTSSGRVRNIPEEELGSMKEIILTAAERGKLFSELPVAWASGGQTIHLMNYRKLRLEGF